jgi:uracil-DNA glycosylase
MYCVHLARPDDFAGFREAARRLAAAAVPPEQVFWKVGEEEELFGVVPPANAAAVTVPATFIQLAEDVICHRDAERFALLYQALWRLAHGERALLKIPSDPLVHRLERMASAVRRDLHKMHAFLRFRRVPSDDGEVFVAWFEPEHHILRRAASFFVGRFASMRWSILTPAGSLHWDGRAVAFGDAIPREQAPPGDELDDWWRTYYRAMFNPARANPQAMRAEMPKKYWRNLPEATLIPTLLADAASRTQAMLEAAPEAARKRIRRIEPRAPAAAPPGTLDHLAAQAGACERCALQASATQTVFGEGLPDAPVMLVGEQPGDAEDLAGRPFVGPAGKLLDRALAAAGIDRKRLYLTNAVKHFKFVPRGKRRMHQTPSSYEIQQCRWWLEQERALIRPQLTVALGATAAQALVGEKVAILRERGRIVRLQDGTPGLITVHPSFLLRLPDGAARAREFDRLVADLAELGRFVPEVRLAATPRRGRA